MDSHLQSISGDFKLESMFSVDQDLNFHQKYPIDIDEEDIIVSKQRKADLLLTSQPEIMIGISKESRQRDKCYEKCQQIQQTISGKLALISHIADQTNYKMHHDNRSGSGLTSEVSAIISPLSNDRSTLNDINELKLEIRDINNMLDLTPSSKKTLIESELLKFPSILQESYIELSMEQSADRGYHEIHIVNKTYYEWDSLILYEEKTRNIYKTLPKLKPNKDIDLKIEFQYDALGQHQVLDFKILSFARTVSNICKVALFSIRNIEVSKDKTTFSFEIVSHTSTKYSPVLYFWDRDNRNNFDSKPISAFSAFGSKPYKKLPRLGRQTCVELRVDNTTASRVYLLQSD